jgi:hypothetical protein
LAWEISAKKISNERCLSDTILSNQKNLRFGCKRKDCEQRPCEFHEHKREENMISSPLSFLLTIKFNIRQEGTYVKLIILVALFH